MKKLLLFLSAGHLDAQLMSNRKIVRQHEFPDSPQGRQDFAGFLQQANHPTWLLTDLIEEDFRKEAIPHLMGRSRNLLLQRKLSQFYRDTPFCMAALQQRQKTGRGDDEILYSALTNPSLITPWLDIMLSQRTLLAGIYSIPQISAPLIKDHPSNCLLLISWEKQAGLRQSYFNEHRLRISRLTPVGNGLTFQQAVIQELPRTYQYLKSLSLLPPGQTLDVRLIGHSHDLVELQQALPKSADMRYDFADLAGVARQLGMDHCFTDSDARPVFLHLLTACAPKTHYADTTHTHYFALRKLKHALNLASALLLSGMAIWGAGNFRQSGSDAEETASLNAQVKHALNNIQNLTPATPDAYNALPAEIKTGVTVMRKLDQYSVLPDDILHTLGEVLDRQPQIELDGLAWQINSSETAGSGRQTGIPLRTILLKGSVTGSTGNYRAALDGLERFRHDLGMQGYQVSVLARPLDISPNGSIADLRESQPGTSGFMLKITLRPAT